MPPVDPKDAFMLGEVSVPTPNGIFTSSSTLSTPQTSWLRKTEYISSFVNSKLTPSHDSYRTNSDDSSAVVILREAQLKDIENLFRVSCDAFDLSKLKHRDINEYHGRGLLAN